MPLLPLRALRDALRTPTGCVPFRHLWLRRRRSSLIRTGTGFATGTGKFLQVMSGTPRLETLQASFHDRYNRPFRRLHVTLLNLYLNVNSAVPGQMQCNNSSQHYVYGNADRHGDIFMNTRALAIGCTAAFYRLNTTTTVGSHVSSTIMCLPSTYTTHQPSDTVTPKDTNLPTIVVHDDYGEDVPPHPGQDWTRFVCISDTHSKTFPLPDGDVLIHSGDLCSWGTVKQLKVTMDWLVSLPHPTKM